MMASCLCFPLGLWPLKVILKAPLCFPMVAPSTKCFGVGMEGGEDIVKTELNSDELLKLRFFCSPGINVLEASRLWLAEVLP